MQKYFISLSFCDDSQKAALVWSPAPEAAHAHVSKPSPSSAAGTPPTPATLTPGHGGGGQANTTTTTTPGGQQQHNNNNNTNNNNNNNNHHGLHHQHHHHGPSSSSNASNNPPTQQSAGLMHWMSVMAEHMTNPHHHDVHYMWNGVEVKKKKKNFFSPWPVFPRQ